MHWLIDWRHVVQLGVEREPVTVLVRFLRFLVDFGKGCAHNLAIIAKKSCRSLCRHIDASTRVDGKIDRCVDVFVKIKNRYGSRSTSGLTTWWFWRDGGRQHRFWTLNFEWKVNSAWQKRAKIASDAKTAARYAKNNRKYGKNAKKWPKKHVFYCQGLPSGGQNRKGPHANRAAKTIKYTAEKGNHQIYHRKRKPSNIPQKRETIYY